MKIVMGFDGNYVWPWFVAAHALQRYKSTSFQMLIGYDERTLTTRDRILCTRLADHLSLQVSWRPLETVEVPAYRHIPPTTFHKLLLADQLDEYFVWLDPDILPLPLWQLVSEHSDKDSELVRGYIDIEAWRNLDSENQAKETSHGRYINAGVMGIDGRVWSRSGYSKKWRAAVDQYKKLGFQWLDQCTLNYCLEGQVSPLSSTYNFQPGRERHVTHLPRIIHFSGALKPWKIDFKSRYRIAIKALLRDTTAQWFQLYYQHEDFALTSLNSASSASLYRTMVEKRRLAQSIHPGRYDNIVYRSLEQLGNRRLG